jgi:hypothetical protein
MQENRDPAPAFLQNPILVRIKSQRSINDFRILHGQLNSFGEDDAPFLIASMYRHLAYWPPFLALIRTALAPLQADQSLIALTHRARALGRVHGGMLSSELKSSPPPPSLQDALASCRLFVEHPIARMTGICALIRDAIGDATRPGEP